MPDAEAIQDAAEFRDDLLLLRASLAENRGERIAAELVDPLAAAVAHLRAASAHVGCASACASS